MFLTMLQDEEKKGLFLDLVMRAANSNKHVADQQKAVYKQYCMEMGLEDMNLETNKDLEDLLDELMEICGETELRIITFETLGMLLSDNTYDDMEREFFRKVTMKFSISDELADQMFKLINEYQVVFDKICKVVL